MNPNRIVITGTIASGKSTLAKILSNLGFVVISADEVNRDLLKEGGINYKAIKNSGIFDECFIKGHLDKKKLAKIIFSSKEKQLKLNELTHKNILAEIENRIASIDQKAVFIENPLYFQTGATFPCDEVWLVVADYDTQLTRLMQRDNIDLSYAKTKIESQKSLLEMRKQSDEVFDNSSSVTDLMNDVKLVLEKKDLL